MISSFAPRAEACICICQLGALACDTADTAVSQSDHSPNARLPSTDAASTDAASTDAASTDAASTPAADDQDCGSRQQAERFVDLPCAAAHDLPDCEPAYWVQLDAADASIPCEFDVAQFGVGRRGEDITPTQVVVWAGVDGYGDPLPELDGPTQCTPQLETTGFFLTTSSTAAVLSLCPAACDNFDQLLICVQL